MELHTNNLLTTIMAHPLALATLLPILLLFLTIILMRRRRTQISRSFPPGPPPLPLIGNLHQIPLQKPFFRFAEWSRTYSSPIIGIHLATKPAIILNTWQAVRDLFDVRGANYSNRPDFPLVADYVVPDDNHVAFMKYDRKWRRGRAALTSFLREEELVKVRPIQEDETSQMVWEILRRPGEFEKHVMRAFCAVILESVYGIRGTLQLTERFFKLQDEWAAMLDMGAMPPLDLFPWLKYIPSMLTPWPRWRKRSVNLGKFQKQFYDELVGEAKEKVEAGAGKDTFMAKLLVRQEKEGFSDAEVAHLAGFLIEAGADTTATGTLAFMLAMITHPDVQKRAREEVDAVFGESMPRDVDRAELPYLRGVLWEALRWRPSFNTSIAHQTSKDDVYEGYFIPAGTTIIMNTWAIHNNEDDYPNPDVFDPTRFLANEFGSAIPGSPESDIARRRTYAFGAGRRVCAGQVLAEQTLMLSMAKLLWAFDMRLKDGAQLDVSVKTGFKDAILSGPKEVPVEFMVRSATRAEVICKEWEKADAALKRFE